MYQSVSRDSLLTIGLDYGSLSCRGVLADTRDGSILAEETFVYPHGVLSTALPDGTPLPQGWYLQHPADYTDAFSNVIPALLRKSGASAQQVAAIGVDTTASTVIPITESMRPLCLDPAFSRHPHAWPKMWKHHAAHKQAARLTQICTEQNRPYLDWYGGTVSPECLLSKVVETFECDRAVFDAAHAFIELADWIPSLLTGKPVFSTSLASAKSFYDLPTGYPDSRFFSAVDPALARLPAEKLMDRYPHRTLVHPCESAGVLCPEAASELGLCSGTIISAGQMDAYAPLAALGVYTPGILTMILGTSTGLMLLSDQPRPVKGVTASLPDTFFPGLWGYASGQASVGDALQWFTDHCIPGAYENAASAQGVSVHQYLTHLAAALAPGETGIMCLEWLNGNKSCLGNPNLSGMFVGLTLQSRPEHLYRALLEATAFGARSIVDAYQNAGVPIHEIRACGGIAGKNPLMMQIYADVLGIPLHVSRCTQAPSLGAAICAAAAAGQKTGFRNVNEAIEAMADSRFTVYRPDAERQDVYEALYREYKTLHDYFGCGSNRIMERLHAMRNIGGDRL